MAPTPGTTISPPDWITMVARREQERGCVIRPDGSEVTYVEARNAINGLANWLNERSVIFGPRVAILGVDSPENVVECGSII
jgi:acyl-CoA synthetase (AMP-forming)/AMP-acid ligase II